MATMRSWIGLGNRIQRTYTVLGGDSAREALPSAAGQRSGKSSVFESIVGRDFLPRGSGMVTRRPLVLQLHQTEQGVEEYAEFLHLPKKRVNDFLVNLTPKDLPGLAKVAVEGQPESIIQDIETTVRSYVDKPNCIILPITPANQDVATSDAIKLAREVDPTGVRSKAQFYTILELSRAFERIFREHLNGGRPGGDRIYGVFDQQLPSALRKLPFNRHLALQNIQKVISEADGYQPHLVAPEQGYRRLIDIALNYFRGPAEASVDAVHFILKELVRRSILETQELKRFTTLQAELAEAANEALERFRDDSKKTTMRLVDMESSYLTADFFRKLSHEADKAVPSDRYSEGHFRKIGSNVSSYVGMVLETLRNTIPKSVVHCQVREANRSLLDHFYAQLGKKEGKQLAGLLDEDPDVMEKRVQYGKRLELYKSARDEMDSLSWSR